MTSGAAVDRMEVIRRWVELTPTDDWVSAFADESRLEPMRAFLGEVAVPDLQVVGRGGGMDQGALAPESDGVDAMIAFWRDWLEPWESFTLEVEGIVEGPGAVIVDALQQGRLHGSTAVVESRSAAVHFFRGDKLARIEFHLDRDQARSAAGL